MGTAAWRACGRFIQTRTDLGKIRVSAARNQRYEMTVEGQLIPLDITSLAVDQNMRRPVDAAVIREDITEFLRRHRDSQSGPVEPGRARADDH
jgi:hypothetical protein